VQQLLFLNGLIVALAISIRDGRTILAYSPYENVRAQAYPAILALAGLTDLRVFYWELAKWIVRLRRLRTNKGLIASRTNLEAWPRRRRGSLRLSQGSCARICLCNQGRRNGMYEGVQVGMQARAHVCAVLRKVGSKPAR
jgi:hypothetical protein